MKKTLIVYSDYYTNISSSLLFGAKKILKKNNIQYDLFRVDGSFEVPQLLNIKLKTKRKN